MMQDSRRRSPDRSRRRPRQDPAYMSSQMVNITSRDNTLPPSNHHNHPSSRPIPTSSATPRTAGFDLFDQVPEATGRHRHRHNDQTRHQQEKQTGAAASYRSDSSSTSSIASSLLDISRHYPTRTRFGGIFGTFWRAPSERRLRRRRSGRTSKRRVLYFGNSSSSSINSDMAYGNGYIPRSRSRDLSKKGRNASGTHVAPDTRHGSRRNDVGATERDEVNLSRKRASSTKRKKTDEEILALGRQLSDFAKKQNNHDVRGSGKFKLAGLTATAAAASAAAASHRRKKETKQNTRGIGSSRPDGRYPDSSDESDWEDASDDEAGRFSDAESALAYGSVIPHASLPVGRAAASTNPASAGHQPGLFPGTTERLPLWSGQKSSIVDPRLFGPHNSLRGMINTPCGFGEGQPVADHAHFNKLRRADTEPAFRDAPRHGSHVGPVSDSDRRLDDARDLPFRSRPAPIPLQQPSPKVPISSKVYETERLEEQQARRDALKNTRTRSDETGLGRDAKLTGMAAAAAAAVALASDRKSKRDTRREERRQERKEPMTHFQDIGGNPDPRDADTRTKVDAGDAWSEDRDRRHHERDLDLKRRAKVAESDVSRLSKRDSRTSKHTDDHHKKRHTRHEEDEAPRKRRETALDYRMEHAESSRVLRQSDNDRSLKSEGPKPSRKESRKLEDDKGKRRAEVLDRRTIESDQSNISRQPVDPFQFQIYDDTLLASAATASAATASTIARPLTPTVVTIHREPTFDDDIDLGRLTDNETRLSRRDSFEIERLAENHTESSREMKEARAREGSVRSSKADAANHWTAPVAAAVMASAAVVSHHRDQQTSTAPIKDPVQEEADRAYRRRILEEKETRRRSRDEDDSRGPAFTIVTPPAMDDREPKHRPYDGPDADVRIDNKIYPREIHKFQFDVFAARDPSCERERPVLNLVYPTPVPTPNMFRSSREADETSESRDRTQGAAYEGEMTSRNDKADTFADGSGANAAGTAAPSAVSTSARSVAWGDSPAIRSEAEDPDTGNSFEAGSGALARRKKSSSRVQDIVQGSISDVGVGFVGESARGHDKFMDDHKAEPPIPGPKPPRPFRDKMPGGFADDFEFAATLAAGLEDTGFDPNIVIDDPAYRRRDSPPNSSEPTGDTWNDSSLRDAVSDMSTNQRPVSTAALFTEPDEMTADSAIAAADSSMGQSKKLSKKEKKRLEREAKRNLTDRTASLAEESSRAVALEASSEGSALSRKERKKPENGQQHSIKTSESAAGPSVDPRGQDKEGHPDQSLTLRDIDDDAEVEDPSEKRSKKTRKGRRDPGDDIAFAKGSLELDNRDNKSTARDTEQDDAWVDLRRSNSERDLVKSVDVVRSTPGSEVGYDGRSKKRKEKMSRQEGIDFDDGEGDRKKDFWDDRDVSSVVSESRADERRRERRSKRSSHHPDDDDDTKSIASAPTSARKGKRHSTYGDDEPMRRGKDKDSEKGEKRSSGLFATLFKGKQEDSKKLDKESFLDNAGTLGAGAGLATAAALMASGFRSNAAHATPEQAHEIFDVATRDLGGTDSEIAPRAIKPAIDPQYGDLLPLPPSEPGSPVTALQDLPALPDSRPGTPPDERGLSRGLLAHRRRRSTQDTPIKSPSSTAIPLSLRLGQRHIAAPGSPSVYRSPLTGSPVTPESSRRSARISWDSSREIKPLYLLEHSRQGSVDPIPQAHVPALPPSEVDSPALPFAKLHEIGDALDRDEAVDFGLRLNTDLAASEAIEDLAGSQETTPKATTNLALSFKTADVRRIDTEANTVWQDEAGLWKSEIVKESLKTKWPSRQTFTSTADPEEPSHAARVGKSIFDSSLPDTSEELASADEHFSDALEAPQSDASVEVRDEFKDLVLFGPEVEPSLDAGPVTATSLEKPEPSSALSVVSADGARSVRSSEENSDPFTNAWISNTEPSVSMTIKQPESAMTSLPAAKGSLPEPSDPVPVASESIEQAEIVTDVQTSALHPTAPSPAQPAERSMSAHTVNENERLTQPTSPGKAAFASTQQVESVDGVSSLCENTPPEEPSPIIIVSPHDERQSESTSRTLTSNVSAPRTNTPSVAEELQQDRLLAEPSAVPITSGLDPTTLSPIEQHAPSADILAPAEEPDPEPEEWKSMSAKERKRAKKARKNRGISLPGAIMATAGAAAAAVATTSLANDKPARVEESGDPASIGEMSLASRKGKKGKKNKKNLSTASDDQASSGTIAMERKESEDLGEPESPLLATSPTQGQDDRPRAEIDDTDVHAAPPEVPILGDLADGQEVSLGDIENKDQIGDEHPTAEWKSDVPQESPVKPPTEESQKSSPISSAQKVKDLEADLEEVPIWGLEAMADPIPTPSANIKTVEDQPEDHDNRSCQYPEEVATDAVGSQWSEPQGPDTDLAESSVPGVDEGLESAPPLLKERKRKNKNKKNTQVKGSLPEQKTSDVPVLEDPSLVTIAASEHALPSSDAIQASSNLEAPSSAQEVATFDDAWPTHESVPAGSLFGTEDIETENNASAETLKADKEESTPATRSKGKGSKKRKKQKQQGTQEQEFRPSDADINIVHETADSTSTFTALARELSDIFPHCNKDESVQNQGSVWRVENSLSLAEDQPPTEADLGPSMPLPEDIVSDAAQTDEAQAGQSGFKNTESTTETEGPIFKLPVNIISDAPQSDIAQVDQPDIQNTDTTIKTKEPMSELPFAIVSDAPQGDGVQVDKPDVQNTEATTKTEGPNANVVLELPVDILDTTNTDLVQDQELVRGAFSRPAITRNESMENAVPDDPAIVLGTMEATPDQEVEFVEEAAETTVENDAQNMLAEPETAGPQSAGTTEGSANVEHQAPSDSASQSQKSQEEKRGESLAERSSLPALIELSIPSTHQVEEHVPGEHVPGVVPCADTKTTVAPSSSPALQLNDTTHSDQTKVALSAKDKKKKKKKGKGKSVQQDDALLDSGTGANEASAPVEVDVAVDLVQATTDETNQEQLHILSREKFAPSSPQDDIPPEFSHTDDTTIAGISPQEAQAAKATDLNEVAVGVDAFEKAEQSQNEKYEPESSEPLDHETADSELARTSSAPLDIEQILIHSQGPAPEAAADVGLNSLTDAPPETTIQESKATPTDDEWNILSSKKSKKKKKKGRLPTSSLNPEQDQAPSNSQEGVGPVPSLEQVMSVDESSKEVSISPALPHETGSVAGEPDQAKDAVVSNLVVESPAVVAPLDTEWPQGAGKGKKVTEARGSPIESFDERQRPLNSVETPQEAVNPPEEDEWPQVSSKKKKKKKTRRQGLHAEPPVEEERQSFGLASQMESIETPQETTDLLAKDQWPHISSENNNQETRRQSLPARQSVEEEQQSFDSTAQVASTETPQETTDIPAEDKRSQISSENDQKTRRRSLLAEPFDGTRQQVLDSTSQMGESIGTWHEAPVSPADDELPKVLIKRSEDKRQSLSGDMIQDEPSLTDVSVDHPAAQESHTTETASSADPDARSGKAKNGKKEKKKKRPLAMGSREETDIFASGSADPEVIPPNQTEISIKEIQDKSLEASPPEDDLISSEGAQVLVQQKDTIADMPEIVDTKQADSDLPKTSSTPETVSMNSESVKDTDSFTPVKLSKKDKRKKKQKDTVAENAAQDIKPKDARDMQLEISSALSDVNPVQPLSDNAATFCQQFVNMVPGEGSAQGRSDMDIFLGNKGSEQPIKEQQAGGAESSLDTEHRMRSRSGMPADDVTAVLLSAELDQLVKIDSANMASEAKKEEFQEPLGETSAENSTKESEEDSKEEPKAGSVEELVFEDESLQKERTTKLDEEIEGGKASSHEAANVDLELAAETPPIPMAAETAEKEGGSEGNSAVPMSKKDRKKNKKAKQGSQYDSVPDQSDPGQDALAAPTAAARPEDDEANLMGPATTAHNVSQVDERESFPRDVTLKSPSFAYEDIQEKTPEHSTSTQDVVLISDPVVDQGLFPARSPRSTSVDVLGQPTGDIEMPPTGNLQSDSGPLTPALGKKAKREKKKRKNQGASWLDHDQSISEVSAEPEKGDSASQAIQRVIQTGDTGQEVAQKLESGAGETQVSDSFPTDQFATNATIGESELPDTAKQIMIDASQTQIDQGMENTSPESSADVIGLELQLKEDDNLTDHPQDKRRLGDASRDTGEEINSPDRSQESTNKEHVADVEDWPRTDKAVQDDNIPAEADLNTFVNYLTPSFAESSDNPKLDDNDQQKLQATSESNPPVKELDLNVNDSREEGTTSETILTLPSFIPQESSTVEQFKVPDVTDGMSAGKSWDEATTIEQRSGPTVEQAKDKGSNVNQGGIASDLSQEPVLSVPLKQAPEVITEELLANSGKTKGKENSKGKPHSGFMTPTEAPSETQPSNDVPRTIFEQLPVAAQTVSFEAVEAAPEISTTIDVDDEWAMSSKKKKKTKKDKKGKSSSKTLPTVQSTSASQPAENVPDSISERFSAGKQTTESSQAAESAPELSAAVNDDDEWAIPSERQDKKQDKARIDTMTPAEAATTIDPEHVMPETIFEQFPIAAQTYSFEAVEPAPEVSTVIKVDDEWASLPSKKKVKKGKKAKSNSGLTTPMPEPVGPLGISAETGDNEVPSRQRDVKLEPKDAESGEKVTSDCNADIPGPPKSFLEEDKKEKDDWSLSTKKKGKKAKKGRQGALTSTTSTLESSTEALQESSFSADSADSAVKPISQVPQVEFTETVHEISAEPRLKKTLDRALFNENLDDIREAGSKTGSKSCVRASESDHAHKDVPSELAQMAEKPVGPQNQDSDSTTRLEVSAELPQESVLCVESPVAMLDEFAYEPTTLVEATGISQLDAGTDWALPMKKRREDKKKGSNSLPVTNVEEPPDSKTETEASQLQGEHVGTAERTKATTPATPTTSAGPFAVHLDSVMTTATLPQLPSKDMDVSGEHHESTSSLHLEQDRAIETPTKRLKEETTRDNNQVLARDVPPRMQQQEMFPSLNLDHGNADEGWAEKTSHDSRQNIDERLNEGPSDESQMVVESSAMTVMDKSPEARTDAAEDNRSEMAVDRRVPQESELTPVKSGPARDSMDRDNLPKVATLTAAGAVAGGVAQLAEKFGGGRKKKGKGKQKKILDNKNSEGDDLFDDPALWEGADKKGVSEDNDAGLHDGFWVGTDENAKRRMMDCHQGTEDTSMLMEMEGQHVHSTGSNVPLQNESAESPVLGYREAAVDVTVYRPNDVSDKENKKKYAAKGTQNEVAHEVPRSPHPDSSSELRPSPSRSLPAVQELPEAEAEAVTYEHGFYPMDLDRDRILTADDDYGSRKRYSPLVRDQQQRDSGVHMGHSPLMTPLLRQPRARDTTPEPEKKSSKIVDAATSSPARRSVSDGTDVGSHGRQGGSGFDSWRAEPPVIVPRRSVSNTSLSRQHTPEPLRLRRPETPGIHDAEIPASCSPLQSPPHPASHPPPLRRIDKRMSGDLRALRQQSNSTPVANESRARAARSSDGSDMTDVYDGYGEGRIGSPRSPTRPHSMRRRQSMQVLELESKVEQLMAENRLLTEARAQAEQNSSRKAAGMLSERDAEIESLKQALQFVQYEVARLTEVNEGLSSANAELASKDNGRYADMTRELDDARGAYATFTQSLEDKDAQIADLRAQLDEAKGRIRRLQREMLDAKASDSDFLSLKDEDYFDERCRLLCSHVQQWVLRFSKFSDMRACRLTSEISDEKTIDRLDNAMLDGSSVDSYLRDRVRRRDIFMSMAMNMVWEFVFTRYLFGMDREQRQKLKSLEKLLSEVGPVHAVRQWRAVTLTLLCKRDAFQNQRDLDTEAVVQAIFQTLCKILPPPTNMEDQIQSQLRKVIHEAVQLSIEMRTQRAEYMMLPPQQPEYDADGELSSTVTFDAALMSERSGARSNEELEAQKAVVRLVLFPLVVKRGDDSGIGDDKVVICPAQVLVAGGDDRSRRRVTPSSDVGGTSLNAPSRVSVVTESMGM